MPMLLHAAPDDRAIKNIQRGKSVVVPLRCSHGSLFRSLPA